MLRSRLAEPDREEWLDDGVLTAAGKALVKRRFRGPEANPHASVPSEEAKLQLMALFRPLNPKRIVSLSPALDRRGQRAAVLRWEKGGEGPSTLNELHLARSVSRARERVAVGVSTVSATFGLQGRAAFGSLVAKLVKSDSSKSVIWKTLGTETTPPWKPSKPSWEPWACGLR